MNSVTARPQTKNEIRNGYGSRIQVVELRVSNFVHLAAVYWSMVTRCPPRRFVCEPLETQVSLISEMIYVFFSLQCSLKRGNITPVNAE